METKEVKIQIPEGYEIDKENSTFELIRFKLIKKFITYEDVCNKIFKNGSVCFTSSCGDVYCGIIENCTRNDKNNATTKKQLERLLALNQLLNIAEYYNRLHPVTSIVYIIMYNKIDKTYYVSMSFIMSNSCGIKVLFSREEDAQAVINNPNFREILDIIYKF
jgi:hypothetical protein